MGQWIEPEHLEPPVQLDSEDMQDGHKRLAGSRKQGGAKGKDDAN